MARAPAEAHDQRLRAEWYSGEPVDEPRHVAPACPGNGRAPRRLAAVQFGLFSESGYRQDATTAQAYDEDLAEIVEADRLGFEEAWIAETNRVRANTVTDANLLICKLAGITRRIRLGTGIRQLPLHHPVNVVREANICDHLTGGRYILGYGGTRMQSLDQAFQRGLEYDASTTRAAVYESVELMLRCWAESEPFDFEGRFWRGRGIHVLPRPFTKPHTAVAAACSGSAETLELAATRGFIPLLSRGNDSPAEIRKRGDAYLRFAAAAGRAASRSMFRLTRFVHVGATDKQAREDVREGLSAALKQRKHDNPAWLTYCTPWDATLETLSFEDMIDAGCYFIGDAKTVERNIRHYYEASGGFGVLLLYAGLPASPRDIRLAGFRRFAEDVAPLLAPLDPA